MTITLWPLSDFPVFSLRPDKTTEFVMSAATLADMLARVHYAISQDKPGSTSAGVAERTR